MTTTVNLPSFPAFPLILATFVPQHNDPDDDGRVAYANEDFVYEFAAREYGKSRRSKPLRFQWDVTSLLLSKNAEFWRELRNDRDESDDLLWDAPDAPKWAKDYAGQYPFVVRVTEALEAFCQLTLLKGAVDVVDADIVVLRAAYEKSEKFAS